MKRETYNDFFNEVKSELNDFLFKYDVPFDCAFPQNENDDIRYVIDLGSDFGKVNILFESYDNLPENERKNETFTICMRYHNPKHVINTLNCDLQPFLNDDGTFILFSTQNGLESLKNDFRGILETWSQGRMEKLYCLLTPIGLN